MNDGFTVHSAQIASLAQAEFPSSPQDHAAEVFTHYEYEESVDAFRLPEPFRVVVFNAMRGTHFDSIVERINETTELRAPDLVLLSELDVGMARSRNRHVPRELSRELGMNYAFAVEFVELSLGDEDERKLGGENAIGLHGNAILSRVPLKNIRVIRLPMLYDWYAAKQKRIGSRIALVADLAGTELTVVSLHLENFTGPEGRARQVAPIVGVVEGPALIAGDFNTSGGSGVTSDDQPTGTDLLDPVPAEPLFETMSQHGFSYDEANPLREATTPKGKKIDWVFVRGMQVEAGSPAIVPATSVSEPARRISDHDFLSLRVRRGGERR